MRTIPTIPNRNKMKKLLTLIIILYCLDLSAQNTTTFKHVYSPGRLKLIKYRKSVTGRISYYKVQRDGDIHIVVNGLVGEMICQYPPQGLKAQKACATYTKTFPRVRKGDKVTMTGVYVFDVNHRWYEIHPITKLVKHPR